jgi:site-specific DNA recombinase
MLYAAFNPCPGRSLPGEAIERQVWESVAELLRDPQLLVAQYQLRQDQDYGTPQRQEQQRLERRLVALKGEEQRLLDAFQAGLLKMEVLKERSERIAQEQARSAERVAALKQQQQEQQRQAALGATVEDFCRNLNAALNDSSFETKRRILNLVVDKIEVLDDQVTIKHMIPTSNVQLRLNNPGKYHVHPGLIAFFRFLRTSNPKLREESDARSACRLSARRSWRTRPGCRPPRP